MNGGKVVTHNPSTCLKLTHDGRKTSSSFYGQTKSKRGQRKRNGSDISQPGLKSVLKGWTTYTDVCGTNMKRRKKRSRRKRNRSEKENGETRTYILFNLPQAPCKRRPEKRKFGKEAKIFLAQCKQGNSQEILSVVDKKLYPAARRFCVILSNYEQMFPNLLDQYFEASNDL